MSNRRPSTSKSRQRSNSTKPHPTHGRQKQHSNSLKSRSQVLRSRPSISYNAPITQSKISNSILRIISPNSPPQLRLGRETDADSDYEDESFSVETIPIIAINMNEDEILYPYEYKDNTDCASFIFSSTLDNIPRSCFENSRKLRSIAIPASVRYIGYRAFANSNIQNVIFESNSKLRVIHASAFYGCKELTTIKIPPSVRVIGKSCFEESGINTLEFVGGYLGDINKKQFYYQIQSPTRSEALSANNALQNNALQIPATNHPSTFDNVGRKSGQSIVHSISRSANSTGTIRNSGNNNVNIYPSQLRVIGSMCFKSCNSLHNFYTPYRIREFQAESFSKSSLELLEYHPKSELKIIGARAFANCDRNKVVSMQLPPTIEYLEMESFANTTLHISYKYMKTQLTHISQTTSQADTVMANQDRNGDGNFATAVNTTNTNIDSTANILCTNTNTTKKGNNSPRNNTIASKFNQFVYMKKRTFYNTHFASRDVIILPQQLVYVGPSVFSKSSIQQILFHPKSKVLAVPIEGFKQCEDLQHIVLPPSVRIFRYQAFMETYIVSFKMSDDDKCDGIFSEEELIYTIPQSILNKNDATADAIKSKQSNTSLQSKKSIDRRKLETTRDDSRPLKSKPDHASSSTPANLILKSNISRMEYCSLLWISKECFNSTSNDPYYVDMLARRRGTSVNFTLRIPESLIGIGQDAFMNSSMNILMQCTNEYNVKYIHKKAFVGAVLTKISLPSTVLYIGSQAFSSIKELESVIFLRPNLESMRKMKLLEIQQQRRKIQAMIAYGQQQEQGQEYNNEQWRQMDNYVGFKTSDTNINTNINTNIKTNANTTGTMHLPPTIDTSLQNKSQPTRLVNVDDDKAGITKIADIDKKDKPSSGKEELKLMTSTTSTTPTNATKQNPTTPQPQPQPQQLTSQFGLVNVRSFVVDSDTTDPKLRRSGQGFNENEDDIEVLKMKNLYQSDEKKRIKNDVLLPKIPMGCFYKCENLQSIHIPFTVKIIGAEAFAYTSLESIYIFYPKSTLPAIKKVDLIQYQTQQQQQQLLQQQITSTSIATTTSTIDDRVISEFEAITMNLSRPAYSLSMFDTQSTHSTHSFMSPPITAATSAYSATTPQFSPHFSPQSSPQSSSQFASSQFTLDSSNSASTSLSGSYNQYTPYNPSLFTRHSYDDDEGDDANDTFDVYKPYGVASLKSSPQCSVNSRNSQSNHKSTNPHSKNFYDNMSEYASEYASEYTSEFPASEIPSRCPSEAPELPESAPSEYSRFFGDDETDAGNDTSLDTDLDDTDTDIEINIDYNDTSDESNGSDGFVIYNLDGTVENNRRNKKNQLDNIENEDIYGRLNSNNTNTSYHLDFNQYDDKDDSSFNNIPTRNRTQTLQSRDFAQPQLQPQYNSISASGSRSRAGSIRNNSNKYDSNRKVQKIQLHLPSQEQRGGLPTRAVTLSAPATMLATTTTQLPSLPLPLDPAAELPSIPLPTTLPNVPAIHGDVSTQLPSLPSVPAPGSTHVSAPVPTVTVLPSLPVLPNKPQGLPMNMNMNMIVNTQSMSLSAPSSPLPPLRNQPTHQHTPSTPTTSLVYQIPQPSNKISDVSSFSTTPLRTISLVSNQPSQPSQSSQPSQVSPVSRNLPISMSSYSIDEDNSLISSLTESSYIWHDFPFAIKTPDVTMDLETGTATTTTNTTNTTNTTPADIQYFDDLPSLDLSIIALTHIGSEAFLNCKYLNQVCIPPNVTCIDSKVFYRLNITSLQFASSSKLHYIGSDCFSYCQFDTIVIPQTVTIICKGAFYGSLVSKVEFHPNSLLVYVAGTSFARTRLREISIPSRVCFIGSFAFSSIDTLEHVYTDENNTELLSIFENSFYQCPNLHPSTIDNLQSLKIIPFVDIWCDKNILDKTPNMLLVNAFMNRIHILDTFLFHVPFEQFENWSFDIILRWNFKKAARHDFQLTNSPFNFMVLLLAKLHGVIQGLVMTEYHQMLVSLEKYC